MCLDQHAQTNQILYLGIVIISHEWPTIIPGALYCTSTVKLKLDTSLILRDKTPQHNPQSRFCLGHEALDQKAREICSVDQ
jgi:hypothetical protein